LLYRQGLANGAIRSILSTGAVGDYDQALAEMAAIGFALALAPARLGSRLTAGSNQPGAVAASDQQGQATRQ